MLISVEGPDRAGKTTVFDALRSEFHSAVFVPGYPIPPELIPFMHLVEPKFMALWDALYDPHELYICDRCSVVSSMVYDRLYNRPTAIDVDKWIPEIRVIYMDVPVTVLRHRYAESGDVRFDAANYEAVVECYEAALKRLEHVRISGTLPPAEMKSRAIGAVKQFVAQDLTRYF